MYYELNDTYRNQRSNRNLKCKGKVNGESDRLYLPLRVGHWMVPRLLHIVISFHIPILTHRTGDDTRFLISPSSTWFGQNRAFLPNSYQMNAVSSVFWGRTRPQVIMCRTTTRRIIDVGHEFIVHVKHITVDDSEFITIMIQYYRVGRCIILLY